jgi:hypothetical protein
MDHEKSLREEVEQFLAESGMGASYFGKKAVGNSELVHRLRAGKHVLTITDARVREFIREERASRSEDAA